MAKYYNQGLGTVDTSSVTTSSGDELARAANYIVPAGVSYGDHTWENKPISDRVDSLIRYADQPQLKSPSITIVTPSGSIHYIYDSTNQVTIIGTASENNSADYSLAYAVTGITTGSGSITKGADWSFLTPYLNFGNSIIRATITSVRGPTNNDTVTISRTPTLPPVITITTPTAAPTASTIYSTIDVGGTATDPNSLDIDLNYRATAPGDTVFTQYFTNGTHWTCLSNCTWDGDSYNESGPGMNIRPVAGSWYVGFRPDYIRVTVDSSYTFTLRDNTGATIVNLPVTSGVNTLPITWQGNDLGPSESPSYLARISNASGSITNIEFGSAGSGTDENGSPTGVANWTVDDIPLILNATTTVSVTGENSYGLAGTDTIEITRISPSNPVLTITTETSATTASEITIEGTASDPNGLNIVTVSYELSGARTDSGVATGTTVWSFTENLSAGQNRFDVTAINDWIPPLSGSDSLIVTYNAPGCGPPLDHFCDNSIDPLWTVDVNSPGTATEPPGTDFVVTGGSGILASNSCAAVSGVYKTYSGDFDVTAVVSDIDGVNMWQYCGLVGRIDDINFVYACVPDLITKVQGNHCTAGSGNGDNEFWDGTFPLYIRIARVSNDFYIYISNNGSSWTEIVPPITRLSDSRDCQVWLHSGYLSGLGSPQTIKFDWFGNTTDIPDDW